ncbi:MAG: hypothetical protein N2111_08070 [Candidatus Sumerlaeaceae bacterium]|nr:hypothetical protein [Candidatus Sumerlaeaceae bacterium]
MLKRCQVIFCHCARQAGAVFLAVAFLLSVPCAPDACWLHMLAELEHGECAHSHGSEPSPSGAENCKVCVEHTHQIPHVPAPVTAPSPPVEAVADERPADDRRPEATPAPIFVPPKVLV